MNSEYSCLVRSVVNLATSLRPHVELSSWKAANRENHANIPSEFKDAVTLLRVSCENHWHAAWSIIITHGFRERKREIKVFRTGKIPYEEIRLQETAWLIDSRLKSSVALEVFNFISYDCIAGRERDYICFILQNDVEYSSNIEHYVILTLGTARVWRNSSIGDIVIGTFSHARNTSFSCRMDVPLFLF